MVLSLDELEAVRLADYNGLYQEQAASEMNISRQTFGNIIHSAHKKITVALLNGRILKMEGGKGPSTKLRRCSSCLCEWPQTEAHPACPSCHTKLDHK